MDIFLDALNIFTHLNNKFIDIVALSLYVSFLATIIASIFSIYISSLLTIKNIFGKNFILGARFCFSGWMIVTNNDCHCRNLYGFFEQKSNIY